MCYCSVNDVKCIWELVSGDFARAGRSHNRWGGAVRPREHLLEFYYLHLSISNLFNRNKSGRCAPYKSKEVYSYESELSRADLFVFADFVGGLIFLLLSYTLSKLC